MNLYKELVEILTKNNKTIDDIKWISIKHEKWNEETCSYDKFHFCVEIENFINIAKLTYYDNGYGGAEIPMGLIIAGDNWWLERHEYDGSEWFVFKTYPKKPDNIEEIHTITHLYEDEDFD